MTDPADHVSPQQLATPTRQVRAVYDAETVTVYQAYSTAIATAAVAAQTFVPPFKRDRMTWIKPSFLWMMYRSGWATKPGQEHVLEIRMSRRGFEDALALAAMSHYDEAVYSSSDAWLARKATSPVRVQWDPERDLELKPMWSRSLQIGLSGPAVDRYLDDWIVTIADITQLVQDVREAPDQTSIPHEEPYPLPEEIAVKIGATV